MRLLAAVIVSFALSGCVRMHDLERAVRARAARDLGCDARRVQVYTHEGNTDLAGFEATGCGVRRAYGARCKIRQLNMDCDVVGATPVRQDHNAAPGPQPPPAPQPPPL